ncbi:MAG: hypothetical protein AB1938_13265 [Myxococcota bacterium]
MSRPRGFVASWFFAPYRGSADLDLFKRLAHTRVDYDVVQVRRAGADPRVLAIDTQARIDRTEIATDHEHPRTRRARDEFIAGVLEKFRAAPASYDFLLSHSNEVPSHAAALQCRRLRPDLPWIAYFGDPVAKNPYVAHMAEYPLHDEDIATEAATLAQADVVVCNNNWQRDLMFSGAMAKYAHKAVVIPHCFEPAFYPREPVALPERFRFLHVGTLYSVKRTARPVLLAVDRLLELYPRYANRFEVVFRGGPYHAPDRETWAAMRHADHVRLEPEVPFLESLALMRTAHVLISIDGIFTEAEDGLTASPFFPCKLVDYMGAGRPITAVTMERGPTADVLRDSGNLVADDRPDRLAFVLKRYLDGKAPRGEVDWGRYDARVVGAEMESVFRTAARRQAPGAGLQAVVDAARAAALASKRRSAS